MLLFNRLGGGKFSENASPLSKIDESSKLLPAKPAFLVCDGSTTNRQIDGQQQQIGAQNVTFPKSSHFSKLSATAILLIKIDESSKLLRYVTFLDRHPDGGPRNVTFQSARPTGRGPRNVTFQSARPPDGRDRLCRH